MTRTIPMEELPLDTQRILEKLFASGASVILSRGGEPFGEMTAYSESRQDFERETPDEEQAIEVIAEQARADYAAGRYVPFEEIKSRYADILREPGR